MSAWRLEEGWAVDIDVGNVLVGEDTAGIDVLEEEGSLVDNPVGEDTLECMGT